MSLGDAVPDGGVRFLEAFAGDACSGVEEAEEGGENAGGGVFPEQADADECDKDEQPFAKSLEQLGGVARVQELAEGFTLTIPQKRMSRVLLYTVKKG